MFYCLVKIRCQQPVYQFHDRCRLSDRSRNGMGFEVKPRIVIGKGLVPKMVQVQYQYHDRYRFVNNSSVMGLVLATEPS